MTPKTVFPDDPNKSSVRIAALEMMTNPTQAGNAAA